LEILDYQKNELVKVIKKSSKDLAQAIGASHRSAANSITTKFLGEFIASLNEALLPHQIKSMEGMLLQRNFQKQLGCDSVLLPVKLHQRLGMSAEESALFVKATKELVDSYNDKRKQIADQAMNACRELLSKEQALEFKSYREISQGSTVPIQSITINPIGIENWSEKDFERLEKLYRSQVILEMKWNPVAQYYLEVDEAQLATLDQAIHEFQKGHDEIDPVDAAKFLKYAQDGDVKSLKELHEKEIRKSEDARIDLSKKVAEVVFRPGQMEFLNKFAEFRRQTIQSRYGDEFGAIEAICRIGNNCDLNKCHNVIVEVRKEYYSRIESLRKKTFPAIIDKLPESGKTTWTNLFGSERYEWEEERLQTWNEQRLAFQQ
jgi:hypothetical protein